MRMIRKILEMLFKVLGLPYVIAKQIIKWIPIVLGYIVNGISYLFNGIVNIIQSIGMFFANIIKYIYNFFANIIKFIYKWLSTIVKWLWNYLPKLLMFVGKWFIDAVKESIAQIFTLLGFFIAWLTLTGSAKDIVGIAILISVALWLLTMGLRKNG